MSLLALALIQAAEPAPEPVSTDEIVVTGTRESTLDLKKLQSARRIYLEGRAQFAPQSRLLFELRPRDGVRREGMTLTLRNRDQEIPVEIDGDGRFTLPELPPGKWELFHNRGKGRIAIRPQVLSPGTTNEDRLLGDYRLQCRVSWKFADIPFSFRAMIDTAGGCANSRFAFYFGMPHPIATAQAIVPPGTRDLAISTKRTSFRPPISDKALANTVRIRVTYS